MSSTAFVRSRVFRPADQEGRARWQHPSYALAADATSIATHAFIGVSSLGYFLPDGTARLVAICGKSDVRIPDRETRSNECGQARPLIGSVGLIDGAG